MLYKYKISTTIYCGELEEYERVILSPLQRTFIRKIVVYINPKVSSLWNKIQLFFNKKLLS